MFADTGRPSHPSRPHTSTVEKPGASGGSKPSQAPRSSREKTVPLTAAAQRRFARAPLPAKDTPSERALAESPG